MGGTSCRTRLRPLSAVGWCQAGGASGNRRARVNDGRGPRRPRRSRPDAYAAGDVMTTIDAIALEVLWSRLLSVTNEQQAALRRTAFSTGVRESQDLACGVFDTRGNMVAQSETGTPGHINAMATCMRHFMAAYPERSLEQGDVLITNDPWMTAGQINDVTLVTPIFTDGRVVAYFANTCHMLDIGGRILSAEAREVYEEGLYIPITKLFFGGKRNEEVFKVIPTH